MSALGSCVTNLRQHRTPAKAYVYNSLHSWQCTGKAKTKAVLSIAALMGTHTILKLHVLESMHAVPVTADTHAFAQRYVKVSEGICSSLQQV